MNSIITFVKTNKLLKSWAKVFGATLLAGYLADLSNVFEVTWSDWQVYITSAVAAVVPLVITWLDPSDSRAGKGKAE